MANEKEKYVYAVVLFLSRKETGNDIDLIPSSWIFEDKKGTLCKYPPREDYDKLEHWLPLLQPAQKEWESFYIEVVSYARK